jgi:hypothetical protein
MHHPKGKENLATSGRNSVVSAGIKLISLSKDPLEKSVGIVRVGTGLSLTTPTSLERTNLPNSRATGIKLVIIDLFLIYYRVFIL